MQDLGAVRKGIGSRVEERRKSRPHPGNTRHGFARESGVSVNTLYRIETGKPGVSLDAYLQVAEIMGCLNGFDDLFGQEVDLLGAAGLNG